MIIICHKISCHRCDIVLVDRMEKEGVLRLFSADQIPILLSVAYDDEEITRLTKMMEKVAEKLIGGRITNQVIPEIRYSASILYILACCLPDVLKHREESDGISTLGQSFCGLSLFESTPSLSSSSSASSFQSLALSRCLLFAALHGASKYISTRRSLILPPLIEAVQVLFSSETSTTDGVSSLTETPLNTTPPYAELCQNTLNSYIITPAQEAVSKLWSAAGDSSNARWDSIQAVWSAVHDLLFFASSRGAQRFPTLATRLSRVIFLRTRPSSSQAAKLDMLIWLLTLRLGLHGMHGLRVFLAHLLYRRPPKLKVDDAANESGISDIDTSTEDLPMTPSTIICGLCREYMQPPTSIPCGHIYCWNCLLSLCASGAGGTSVACPSCRQAFKPQSIRVLYDY